MPLAIPEELNVTKLKEAFTKVEGCGEVNGDQFGEVLNTLEVQAKALDKLLLFDFIDQKSTGVINYMQFYNLIKANVQNFGECSASDLVLNLAMEHSMSRRGRQVRLDFKKRLTESNEERMKPIPIKKRPAPQSTSNGSSPEGKEQKTELKETSSGRKSRRQSIPDEQPIEKTVNRVRSYGRAELEFSTKSIDFSKVKSVDNDSGFNELKDTDYNPEPIESKILRVAEDIDEVNENQPRFRVDSVLSEDMFTPKDEDRKFGFGKVPSMRHRSSRSLGQKQTDSVEVTIKDLMKNYKQSILKAVHEHITTDRSLLKELKQIALAAHKHSPNIMDENSVVAKDETERLLQRVLKADVGKLDEQIDKMRDELRSLQKHINPQAGAEIQRTLESLVQTLSNVENHIAFNLGTKMDHLESKLNKILCKVTRDKSKNVEPQTDLELLDERRRLKEAMKFVESLVKNFKKQKAAYKSLIVDASEQIRKERKQLAREKDRIKKEANAIEKQKIDVKERFREVSRAQRKLNKRKGSGLMTPIESNLSAEQLEEVERMKENSSRQEQQLTILKTKQKEERKKFQDRFNELKKKNRYLENDVTNLRNDLSSTTNARDDSARKQKELTYQIAQLENERQKLIMQKGALRDAELQSKEIMEKEREDLAKRKEQLKDIAQKLTEERNNHEAATELDNKAKNIASQMQDLADERETLYIEREKFEEERNAVLAVWAEKEKLLKEQNLAVQAMREKKDDQAKIMKQEYPKFKSRQSKLEDQEQINEEDEILLKNQKQSVERQLNNLKVKAINMQAQKVDLVRRNKDLIKNEAEVKALEKKMEKMKEELTVTKTQLQVKQDAFESITRDFERAAEKGKSAEAQLKQLIAEEKARLQKEFEEEKKVMEQEFSAKMALKGDKKELRKKAEQLIQEERLILEQERERIKYLAQELHSTMDVLEKEKKEDEEEKVKWIRVIQDITGDQDVVKKIQKKFERLKGRKKK